MTDAGDIGLTVAQDGEQTVLTPRGDWTVLHLAAMDSRLRELETQLEPGAVVIELSSLGHVDTAGAFALGRVLNRCGAPNADFHFRGDHPSARRLMELTRERFSPCPPERGPRPGLVQMFDRIGRGLERAGIELVETVAFFGQLLVTMGRAIANPARIRWTPIFHVMETAGVNALPIVGTLAFFIGAVVAYLGASVLQQFNATVFAVELVALSVLREFGVVITAILLAGRSDSAFTAQIGSMRMQQEIDAMRALGLDPFEVLVLPRVLACLIMAPLLTFAAMMMGLLGGMLAVWVSLEIQPSFFIARMGAQIDPVHFWAGWVKAPVFALVIAIIGCRHGMQVEGDVESLGRHVTSSVVQSIFAVIVLDALFAIAYLEMGI